MHVSRWKRIILAGLKVMLGMTLASVAVAGVLGIIVRAEARAALANVDSGPGHDGSSLATAVTVHAENESDGVSTEYTWLATNYPRDAAVRQSLVMDNGRAYDAMTMQAPSGQQWTIYFDISEFFGKW
jgi:hypothetical protein